MHHSTTFPQAQWLFATCIAQQCFHGEAKTFAKRNAKTSDHRIPLTSLRLNHSKLNQQSFQVLYVGIAVSSLLSRFLGAMTVLVIRMISPGQRRPTMKSTPCLSLKWRFLARVARPSFSAASHFFSAYELARVPQKFSVAYGFESVTHESLSFEVVLER